jgi:hypothetical protein
MGKKYIEENIEKLRKQKEDNVIGGYRDLVAKTFLYLKKGVRLSKVGYTNPKYSDVSNAVFGNKNEERKIRGFIKDLDKSNYISVYGVGEEKEIKILKDLDF